MPTRPRLRARLVACFAVALLAQGTADARADTPSGDPSANRSLSQTTLQACQSDPSSQDCITSALADINAARAGEGVAPMSLPSSFASLSAPVQLLVLADLEREPRGLVPAIGLSAPLNNDAAAGATANTDPSPTHWYGDAYAANWAGGYPSTLEADFAWMYDDGPGSANLDCTSTDTSGCWGHRHDILMAFDAPLVMGAAATTGQYGTSLAELFVGGDTETRVGQPDQLVGLTWAAISGDTSGTSSSGSSSSAAGSPTTTVIAVPTPARVASTPRVLLTHVPARVHRGRRFSLRGTVTGAGRGRRVELQRLTRHGWVSAGTARLRGGSRFAFRVRDAAHGRLRLRVELLGAGRAGSRVASLRVR